MILNFLNNLKKINEIINNQNKFYEIKNKHIYFKIVNETSYNLKKLIQETWKLLNPVEEPCDEDCIDIGIRDYSDSDDSDDSDDSE